MKTHYQTLNVSADAPKELIAESAKKLLLILQPRQNASEAARQEYLDVARAYKVLSDPLLRAAYDADLQSQPASNVSSNSAPQPEPEPEPLARSVQSKPLYATQDNNEHSERMAGYGIGPSSLGKVRKGEASLAKTFWYYTLFMPSIVSFFVMFFIGITMGLLGKSQDEMDYALGLYTVTSYAFFFFFSLPAVWRSSRHPTVSPFWKYTSRTFMLMPAIFAVIGILAAVLLPAYMDYSRQKNITTETHLETEAPLNQQISKIRMPEQQAPIVDNHWLTRVRETQGQISSGAIPVINGTYSSVLTENSGRWPKYETGLIESMSLWWSEDSNGFRVKISNTTVYSMKTVLFSFEAKSCENSNNPVTFYIVLNRSIEPNQSAVLHFPNGRLVLSQGTKNCLIISNIWDQNVPQPQQPQQEKQTYKNPLTRQAGKQIFNGTPLKQNCVYKPIMTKKDYDACGITPP